MRVVVGLGNPESKYDGTYHNTGFLVADLLAEKLEIKFKKLDCRAWTAVKSVRDDKQIVAKPTTYMNLSGESVKGFAVKYGLAGSDILVVYDDLDLSIGAVRIREAGSSGTHNGMRSVIGCLKREDFPRIRVGIGRPETPMEIAEYVLSRVSRENEERYLAACRLAADAAYEYLCGVSMDKIMNRYNTK